MTEIIDSVACGGQGLLPTLARRTKLRFESRLAHNAEAALAASAFLDLVACPWR
jgi:hypothetical protein